jgi:hypothetical protein
MRPAQPARHASTERLNSALGVLSIPEKRLCIDSNKIARCKIRSVPVVRETGRALGVMAFFNPADAADFASRHVFLAHHLGRQTAGHVDAQFYLMTGVYTRALQIYRDGAEQLQVAAKRLMISVPDRTRSLP